MDPPTIREPACPQRLDAKTALEILERRFHVPWLASGDAATGR